MKWNFKTKTKHFTLQYNFKKLRLQDCMETNKEHINLLKTMVENKLNRKPISPSDFEISASSIFEHTKEYISPKTLMRLWGYVNEPTVPRSTTLNILARYLNHRDFNSFIEYLKNDDEEESKFIASDFIRSEKLDKYAKIELRWNPNRRCVIIHIGNSQFEIIDSENSKLKVGDKFKCSNFVQNEPLYIFDLETANNQQIDNYVIGCKSGLSSVKLI